MAKLFFPNPAVFRRDIRDNLLWIQLQPRRIVNQQNVTSNVVSTEIVGDKYLFLAPMDLQEQIQHTWEPLENIASKLSQAVSSTAQTLEQSYTAYKAETPLMYKDSNRRELTFVFVLAYTGTDNSIYEDTMKPVKDLARFSSPNITGELTQAIAPPYVFQIRSMWGGSTPKNVINIRNAALTAIQPSYKGPYIDGYPTQTELSLTFTDMEPVDKDRSFEKNVEITTS